MDGAGQTQAAERAAPTLRRRRAPTAWRRGLTRLLRLLATVVLLCLAVIAGVSIWEYYVTAPWTRDGRVRAQVANIAPQVSGQIVSINVADNQPVRRGDVLYVIDPFDFQVAVTTAEASVENAEADLSVKQLEAERRQQLTTVSTSIEEKQRYIGSAKMAVAALSTARANLAQAKVNLERTQVRSTVTGRVTNLLLRVGDYATTGSTVTAVLDTGSFWVDGYFEETKMPNIHVGDPADVLLMGYHQAILGHVQSVTLGISTSDAAPSTQGLPDVNPVYTWVRLAQRVPVRIHIDSVPPGIPLVAGMTATVSIRGNQPASPLWPGFLRSWIYPAPVVTAPPG